MRTLPTFLVAGLLLAPVTAQLEKEPPAGKTQDAKLEKKAKPKSYDLGSTVDAELTLRDINGNTHRFGDYRGKVVLFYFWSKSCPWVVHNEHKLTDLDDTYKKNKDVVVLAINANHTEIGKDPQLPVMPKVSKDADEVVQKKAAADVKAITDEARKHYAGLHRYMKRADLHHTILADHGNKVANMFQARTTPHCYVPDKKGVLRYAGALCNDRANRRDEGEVRIYPKEAVDALLAGKEVPDAQTRAYG
ncbi:MAG: redoxin domain-containing protein [Planctomycetota bacterium]|jgi:peroxiredoxin